LLLIYCPVNNTLFEVSPENRCSSVLSRYGSYGNHAAGSKPIKNTRQCSVTAYTVNVDNMCIRGAHEIIR